MVIAIIGCIAEVEKDKIFIKAPCVDIILSPQSHLYLQDFVSRVLLSVKPIKTKKNKNNEKTKSKETKRNINTTNSNIVVATNTHLSNLELNSNVKFDFLAEERTNFNGVSAYVTIQEGCNKFCTYCVVPNTRGRELARPASNILKEVSEVVKCGAKEIVLLGQNVSSYKYSETICRNTVKKTKNDNKKDCVKTWSIVDLIKEIARIRRVVRIRYITSHPIDITQDLIDLHRDEPKIMPYLHLPVQSGSDEILRKMNRKYTSSFYLDIIKRFRKAVPNIVFSSDFIVGFPSETEKDFKETIKLVNKVNYKAQCFSFKYSRRPNTVANLSKEQIPDDVSSERLKQLQDVLEKQRMKFAKSLLRKVANVLFDNINMSDPLQVCGRDEYMHLVIVNCKTKKEKGTFFGKLIQIKIIKVEANVLIGEKID